MISISDIFIERAAVVFGELITLLDGACPGQLPSTVAEGLFARQFCRGYLKVDPNADLDEVIAIAKAGIDKAKGLTADELRELADRHGMQDGGAGGTQ